MVSVMNNECELDRKPDSFEEHEVKPRVVDDGVDSANGVVDGGGGDTEKCVDLMVSEETRVSPKVVESGGEVEGTVLDGGGVENVKSEDGRFEEVRVCSSEEVRVGVESDSRRIDKEMESRVFEVKGEDVSPRARVVDFGGQNDQFDGGNNLKECMVASVDRLDVQNDRFDAWNDRMELMVSRSDGPNVTPRASVDQFDAHDHFDAWNDRTERMISRSEGQAEVEKCGVSQYDSLLSKFDDYVANGMGGAAGVGTSNASLYGFELGDMVWGKVKSHPWWPGHIFTEAFASSAVRRTRREGHILVAFFGDSSYGWFDPSELVPFDPNFAEKSRQTNSRNFIKAVEEAVDEMSRRRALGLACRCRNPYNFRPTGVQGYFAVDVGDYEPGGVYSAIQIRKSRDSFRPSETLDFIKQLALTPRDSDQKSIDWVKNKATVFAYRKAVFEEFDETYAQAFGMQPVRPSHEPKDLSGVPVKVPPRAPLSGPLVIAEALGGGKSSTKPVKVKDLSKKDRYLLKRRDEPNGSRSLQTSQGQASSSATSAYVEGSSSLASGDYVFQKRALAVQIKPQIPAKQEQAGTFSGDANPASGQDGTGKEASTVEKKPVVSLPFDQAPAYGSAVATQGLSIDAGPFLNKEKSTLQEMKGRVELDTSSPVGSDLSGKGIPDVGTVQQEGEAMVDFKHEGSAKTLKSSEGFQQPKPSFPKIVEGYHGMNQVQDSRSGVPPLPIDANHPGEDLRMSTESGVKKKAKVLKRPIGDVSFEKSNLVERKKKKKKEISMETSSDHLQKRSATGKNAGSVGKSAGKSIQIGVASRVESQVDHRKKEGGASSSLSDSVGTFSMASMGNIELEHLLSDLQALALDPFHGAERSSPVIVRQFFLRFRSLVYQKSLFLAPPAETETVEVRPSKSATSVGASENPPGENVRDPPTLKPPKSLVRPYDPAKGGRKRGPSDRQEEIAAKRVKKINDLKSLAAEKKASLKAPEAQLGEGKETVAPAPAPAPPKPVRIDSVKKIEPPARVDDPTMLVMKFPPRTSLPSVPELKARFARFGSLDLNGTRVFWKSYTCRVVFLRKLDAEAAYRYAVGNNSLFGNVSVRYHLRDLGIPAAENPDLGKGRVEDTSNETPQPWDSATGQGLPAVVLHQPTLQPAVQLKSCLKKSSGDEVGQVAGGGGVGGGGGGRGTPRVKFILGGEESSRGEQLMVGNRNNFNNNATSFADGGASSVAMDFNTMNFQKVIPPSPLPILPLPSQFSKPPQNMHYTEVAPPPRNTYNYAPIAPTSTATTIDISQQMLNLLTRCNDVVTNVQSILGYVPYHPL
ncbi:hypothetical protein L1049_020585 [Liquidambar formosana]|uniref:PWWP domain-containing protein n=1 Tax=Liquidambar formosana TaxID=63359 RepID=A0AAP0SDB1_LIQFO